MSDIARSSAIQGVAVVGGMKGERGAGAAVIGNIKEEGEEARRECCGGDGVETRERKGETAAEGISRIGDMKGEREAAGAAVSGGEREEVAVSTIGDVTGESKDGAIPATGNVKWEGLEPRGTAKGVRGDWAATSGDAEGER